MTGRGGGQDRGKGKGRGWLTIMSKATTVLLEKEGSKTGIFG